MPTCTPVEAPTCASYVATPRQVIVFAHALNGGETPEIAAQTLDWYASMRPQADTVFVYALSKDGTRAFNGGICCTFNDVDDVSYLVRAVADLGQHTAVNAARVGIFGLSNGGMLALRAACERPDVFDAGASWAGTFAGPCSKPGARVAQMHGAADTFLPVRGGSTYIAGRWIQVPPATDLAATMAPGNYFPLTVIAGMGHFPSGPYHYLVLSWTLANLRG